MPKVLWLDLIQFSRKNGADKYVHSKHHIQRRWTKPSPPICLWHIEVNFFFITNGDDIMDDSGAGGGLVISLVGN
jgi:hypothetical protein